MPVGGIAKLLAIAVTLADAATSMKSDFPPELARAFQNVDQVLDKVTICLGDEAANDSEELDARDQRLTKVRIPASGIWGWETLRPADYLGEAPMVDCDARDIPSLLTESDEALDALEASFAEHSAMFDKGVWIGNLALCGVGPIKVAMIEDDFGGNDALLITLNKAAGAKLSALTEANVGNPLAIRANGLILMEPQIYEPLMDGQLQLAGPDRADLERVAASLTQCAGMQ
ncbi:MAG: hypothetical protein A2885_20665 [Sphingopyxis sp. RIFCSPHIGHO2_01_FULL_65_24]|nr:MAG: hypothetical protein A2885_20665 [Sphingopyxis sp. RIFCSPHIGHO2_01_FULL_65_24]